MEKNKQLVPKRRFKEFENDGEWEQRYLDEIVSITMGQSPSSKNYTSNPDDYILVQGNSDIKDGKVVPRIWTKQVTKKANKGDLILSVRAPVGDIGKTDFDVVLGRGVAALSGNEFIYQLLVKMKDDNYWSNLITGSTFESINSDDIREAVVSIPKNYEQDKIGLFLKKIDKLIGYQELKIKKNKSIKISYLLNMFPKEGEEYPKKRFKEFTEPWKKTDLEKVARVRTGYPFNSNDFDEHGEYLVITNGNIQDAHSIVDNTLGNRITPNNAVIEEYVLTPNEILVTMDGTVGRTAKVIESNQILAQRVGRLTANINSDFLYQSLQTGDFFDKMTLISHGGTIKHISLSEIESYELMLPSEAEQIKIGSFFKNIDAQIDIEEQKLNKLEQIKQAYLNELFV